MSNTNPGGALLMPTANQLPAPVQCSTPGCTQVLAKHYPSGDVRPVVVGAYVDGQGCLIVTCPLCKAATRPLDTFGTRA